MILLTEAPNDQDLRPLLGGLAVPAPIPHGDVAFWGRWTDGATVRVCGERKKMSDLVQCITASGRYLKQWQDARSAGFDFIFLVLESIYRPGADGLLEVWRGGGWRPYSPPIEYRRIDQFLNEVAWYLGVTVKRSTGPKETASQIISIYLMFQKGPEDHQSLKQFYQPPTPAQLFWRPSFIRRVAKEIEDIGWDRSMEVEKAFGSVEAMVSATEADWRQIPGIGPKTAKKAVSALHTDYRKEAPAP